MKKPISVAISNSIYKLAYLRKKKENDKNTHQHPLQAILSFVAMKSAKERTDIA